MPGRPLTAPRAVHDLRVASRRLREALSLAGANPQGRAVRRVTRAFGRTRDLDIRIAFLRAFAARHPSRDLRLLLRRLEKNRDKARRDAERTLRRVRESGILDDPALPVIPAKRGFAVRQVLRRLRDVTDLAPCVPQEDAAERHHRLRIAVRHLRYAMEIFHPIFGRKTGPWIAALKALQDLLGEIHDCDVWLAALPGKAGGFAALRENRSRRRRALHRRLVAWWAGHQDLWKQLKSP